MKGDWVDYLGRVIMTLGLIANLYIGWSIFNV
jgi:hypothetical protein